MEGGPPCFAPGFTCPALLGIGSTRPGRFRVRGSYPLWPAFPGRSATVSVSDRAPRLRPGASPSRNPACSNSAEDLTRAWVWAVALSLAATRAVSFDFLSSGYLDVSVPPVVASRRMCSGGGRQALPCLGCPIRRSAGQRVLAPHRGLSQLAASFVDFLCQGIHRAPLISSSSKLNYS